MIVQNVSSINFSFQYNQTVKHNFTLSFFFYAFARFYLIYLLFTFREK